MTTNLGKLIDISLEMYQGVPLYAPPAKPRDVTFELEVLRDYDTPGGAGQIVRALHMRLHAGTHVDVPVHFVRGARQLHETPLSTFCGEAVIANLAGHPPNTPVTPKDLEHALAGKLRPGDRLLIRTDWNKRYGQPDWQTGSPYLSPEAVDWCVAQAPVLVGLDFSHAKDAPVSPCKEYTIRAFLEHGIVVLAYLNHLDRVTRDRVTLMALPLSIRDVEASPVRAVVLED